MKTVVHIIASCTARKRARASTDLRLRNLKRSENRAEHWVARLSNHKGERLLARDLYAGDHWTVARDLPTLAGASGLKATLWVASAGYGLIPADALVHPYSATFTAAQPDSVPSPGSRGTARAAELRAWWAALNAAPALAPAAHRSLAELAHAAPQARILVVASSEYLLAMWEDLLAARAALQSTDQLVLFSGSRLGDTALGPHLVVTNARLQRRVGGALGSLAPRLAAHALRHVHDRGLAAPDLKAHYATWARRCPPLASRIRDRASDADVRRYILRRLHDDATATHSRLLREYRAEGHACEQGRFRELFRAARRKAR